MSVAQPMALRGTPLDTAWRADSPWPGTSPAERWTFARPSPHNDCFACQAGAHPRALNTVGLSPCAGARALATATTGIAIAAMTATVFFLRIGFVAKEDRGWPCLSGAERQ